MSLDIKPSLSQLLLAFLLFNAGTECRVSDFKSILASPKHILFGIAFNFIAPLIFISVFSVIGPQIWADQSEISIIIAGLTIVAAMPIAGSAAGWVQVSGGNSSLILGLILGTTLISPLTTPLSLRFGSLFLLGDYSQDLIELALGKDIQYLLMISVIIPSILGILTRYFLGDKKHLQIRAYLKNVGLADLLILNYINASSAMSSIILNPDWDFMLLVFLVTIALSLLGFLGGWFLPILLSGNIKDRTALMYGLGMNNNGTGLVLVSTALADHPLIMIPIIFYNLGQQLIASVFLRKDRR